MKKRAKSPFLKEKPSGTVPNEIMSPYTKELLERSKKARKNLQKLIDEFE